MSYQIRHFWRLISGIAGICLSARYFISIFEFKKVADTDQFLQYEYFSFIVLAIWYLILGILSIVCSLLTFRHMGPKLALAGSIIGSMAFVPTGIAALLILLLAKNDILDAIGLVPES